MALVQKIVSSDSTTGRDGRCAAALKVLMSTALMLNEKLGLSPDEVVSVMAAASALSAEAGDLHSEAAEVFDRWAEMLRSGQPLSWRAEGNA